MRLIQPPLPTIIDFDRNSTLLDAFGRQRVSSPQVLGYGQFEYGLNAEFIESDTGGAGTVTSGTDEASLFLNTNDALVDSYAYAATRAFHRYIPGKSQLVRMTGSFATPQAGLRQRAGYFSTTDGIFVEYDGLDIGWVRRTSTSGSPAEVRTERPDWYDPFDGTGPSGLNIDFSQTTSLLMWIDLEWLGVGKYRWGFASPVDGSFVVADFDVGSGQLVVPYMRTANLPMRAEIYNTTAVSSAATMKWTCFAVDSEGGDENDLPSTRAIDSATTATSLASGTFRPVLAIRAKTTGPNSVTNRGQIRLIGTELVATGVNSVLVRVVKNPTTLTQAGGAITWNAYTDLTEYARFTNAADTVAGGTVLDAYYVPASGQNKGAERGLDFKKVPLVYTEMGSVQDVLVLQAAGVGGASEGLAAIKYAEFY